MLLRTVSRIGSQCIVLISLEHRLPSKINPKPSSMHIVCSSSDGSTAKAKGKGAIVACGIPQSQTTTHPPLSPNVYRLLFAHFDELRRCLPWRFLTTGQISSRLSLPWTSSTPRSPRKKVGRETASNSPSPGRTGGTIVTTGSLRILTVGSAMQVL